MELARIKDVLENKTIQEKLEETHKNLSLCVSMASGYVWKEKVTSFNKLIAKELLDFFEEEQIQIKYSPLKNEYYKTNVKDNHICFHKNNLFTANETLDKEEFLNQKLLYLEITELPEYLTSEEKENLNKILTEEELILLNQCYNRQELNGNRYFLVSIGDKKEALIEVLKKASLYQITIKEYLKRLADNKENLALETTNVLVKTYNNYILELGAYIAKKIKQEITEKI